MRLPLALPDNSLCKLAANRDQHVSVLIHLLSPTPSTVNSMDFGK
jgi:hypothetical protein